jgi:antirestriction protein ArdC/DNA polymerase III epsilon subunit-like protein
MGNKDTNYQVGVEIALASEQELVSRIKSKALELAADANHAMPYTRKVTAHSVFTVVDRSLYANMASSYSVKEHNALKDVSEFIALAQRNKVINFSILEHTDLLPIAHPQSTQNHDMHPIALEKEQAKWFTSIHGLTNETRGLIASAMTSDLNSAEYIYASTRLDSMAEGSIPPEAMFGWRDGIFSGGNSRLARSARAIIQNRDSDGQFARMFGAMSAFVRDIATNTYRKLTGRTVGSDQQGNAYIESTPGDISVVPVSKTKSAGKAYIFNKNKQFETLKAISNKDVSIDSDQVTKADAPPGWNKDDSYNGPGEKWTDGAYNLIKFDRPSPQTRDRIEKQLEIARRSSDLDKDKQIPDPKQIKLGEDGKFYDPDYPLFEISRAKGNTRPFGYAQSWGDVQLLAREDTDLYDRATSSSPEAKRSPRTSQDTDDYQYPEGYYRLNRDVKFTPTGPEDGKSDNYTDDPTALANLFDEEELGDLLRKAVTPDEGSETATGVAGVAFDPENRDVVDDLPAEAIYTALDRATGGEAKYQLAKIYDEGLESDVNTKSLEAQEPVAPKAKTKKRAPKKGQTDEVTPGDGDSGAGDGGDTPGDGDVPGDDSEQYIPPLLRGLSDDELADFRATGEYRSYLPQNREFEIPDNYSSLDPDPVSEAEINRITSPDQSDVFPVGWDDSPLNIAQNYSPEDLKDQLLAAIAPDNENPGQGLISLPTDDGDSFTGAVSAEKIRDALQLQGEDTNSILGQAYESGMQAPDADAPTKQDPKQRSLIAGWLKNMIEEFKSSPNFRASRLKIAFEEGEDEDSIVITNKDGKSARITFDKDSGDYALEMDGAREIFPRTVGSNLGTMAKIMRSLKPTKASETPGAPTGDKTPGEGDGGQPPTGNTPTSSDQPSGPRAVSVASTDLKKGDVAYQTLQYESDELDENGNTIKYSFPSFFTLDEDADPTNTITVESSRGPLTKVSVKGHFPGGPTQEKFWGEGTSITVIRGLPEGQLPPLGDLPELHVPKPKDEKYGDQGQFHPDYMPDRKQYNKDMAERADLWSAPEELKLDGKKEKVVSPKSKESLPKPKRPRDPRKSPFLSAFTDKAREIAKIKATTLEGKKARWEEFKKFFDTKEITYFDTETTGLTSDDRAFQISLTKATGRTKGETLTLWINPEKPLNPETVAELGQRDADGNSLTDEWLQKNGISYEEAGRQVSEFIGEGATLAAYNSPFDEPHLRDLFDAAGADYDSSVAEIFDVLAFADKAQARDKGQAYREEAWNEEFQRMERPRALKLTEQAAHFGFTHDNAHDAKADVDATIHVANSVLDRALETGQNSTLFEVDKQQESYDKELDKYNQSLEKYKSDLEAFNNAREADKKDPIDPVNTDEDNEPTPKTDEVVPNVITPESNEDRPVGELDDKDSDWINDDKNTTAMDLATEDLQPGDYVTVNGRQQRVDAIRIGASYGVEDGVARVTFTDVETGRQFTGNLPRDKAFTGVRRPIDPKSVQVDPDATKDDQSIPLSPKSDWLDDEGRPVAEKDRPNVRTHQTFTLGDGTGQVTVVPLSLMEGALKKDREEDPDFAVIGTIFDADGNKIWENLQYFFTYEGASNEMERRVRQAFIDLTKEDRSDQLEFDFDNASDDVEISKGDEPGYDIDHEEVFDTQYGHGKVVVRKLVDKTGRTWYVMDASGFDEEGEFIDETQEVFSSKEEAIAYGRRWLANSSNVKQNQSDAENPNVEVVDKEDIDQEDNSTSERESQTPVDVDGTEVPSKLPFWESKRRQRGKHRKPKQPSASAVERAERKEEYLRRYLARSESSLPKGSYIINEYADSIQSGDVLYPDGFTVLKVEQLGRNIVFTGFYPGHSMQSLVEYNAAGKQFRLIRNLNKKESPKEGDALPIIRPNPVDYPGGRQNPQYHIDRKAFLRDLMSTRDTWSPPKNLEEYSYITDMNVLNEFTYGFQVYYGRMDSSKQAKLLKRYQKLVKTSADRLSERGLPSDFDEAVPGIPVYIPVDNDGPKTRPRFIDDWEARRPARPDEPGWDTSRLNPESSSYDPRFMGTGLNEDEVFLAIKMQDNDEEAWKVFSQDYWNTNMVLPNGNPIGPMPASFPEELRRELGRPEFTERPQEGAVLRTRDGAPTWVNPDGSTAPFNPEDPTQGTDETDGRVYGTNEYVGAESTPATETDEAPEETQAPPAPPVARPTPQPRSDDQEPTIVEPTPAPQTPVSNEVPVPTEGQRKQFEERRRVINETWTREQNNHISRSADGEESLEVGDLVYHYRLLTDGFPVYGVVTRTGLDAYGNLVQSTTGEMLDYRDTRFPGYVEITYFGQDGKPLTRETVGRKGKNKGQPVLATGVFKRASRNFFVVQKYDGRIPGNSPLATGESIEDLETAPSIPANRPGIRNPRTSSTPRPQSPDQTQSPENSEAAKPAPSNGDSWGTPNNVIPDVAPGISAWGDVEASPSKQTEIPNHRAFEKIMAGLVQGDYDRKIPDNEKLTGDTQIHNYFLDILDKYGYGRRNFETIKDGKKLRSAGASAGVSSRTGAQGEKYPALFIYARRKYNKAILLHELAHLVDASWKRSDKDRGHSPVWYDTYLTLLRGEGFGDLADSMEKATGRKAETTGVLNRVSVGAPPISESKTDFTPEELDGFQSKTNTEFYSVGEAIELSGSNSSAIDKINSLVNGTDEDPYALFSDLDLAEEDVVVSDSGVPVESLFTDFSLFPGNPAVEKIKEDSLSGISIPPILVVERNGKLYVADIRGLDRAQAAYELGLENIPALIISSKQSTPPETSENTKFYSFGEISSSNSQDYTMLAIQSDKSEQARDKVVSSIISALEAGTVPWRKPWSSSGVIPVNGSTDKTYSGLNTVALWASGAMGEQGDRAQAENVAGVPFTTNIWMGFNQAKELGGSVKKGSKGTSILRPIMRDVEVSDKATGEKSMEKRRVGYADTTVFNLDQISGLDNLRPEASTKEPIGATEGEKILIDSYKDGPPIKNAPQDSAYYVPSEDVVYLPNRDQFDSPEAYFETLAHEFVHSTGNEKRLDRSDLIGRYSGHRASRAEEELIADIGAGILSSMLGVSYDEGQTAAYIASWLEALKNDQGMIIKAASAAQKAVDYILKDANLGAYGKTGEEIAREAKEER